MKKLILAAALIAGAAIASAQGFGGRGMRGFGGGSPTMLLMRSDVQHDIALTDDQKTKLDDIQQDMRAKFQAGGGFGGGQDMTPEERQKQQAERQKMMKETNDKINAVLTDDQRHRLLEIYVQLNSYSAVQNEDVQKNIGWTDDQKAKMKDLTKEQNSARQALFQKMQDGEMDRSQMGDAMSKINDHMKVEIGKLLTDDQKAKLKAMEGSKKFEADPEPGPF